MTPAPSRQIALLEQFYGCVVQSGKYAFINLMQLKWNAIIH